MNRRRSLLILPAQDGRSVKSLLTTELEMSASHIARLKQREGGILLNGVPVYTNERVRAGDRLSAAISDGPILQRPSPMAYPLEIVYEDEDMLVINKPAGIAVHASTRAPDELTLENALAAYLPEGCGMHPVSRLDKGTTGLMTIAKSGYMHELLRRRQHSPAFVKTYAAITVDCPQPPEGRIDAPLGYAPASRYKMAVIDSGAPSVTAYATLGIRNGLALLRVSPETGRTHQIRVHLSHIGCPLLGDWLYGAEDARIGRPALHAHTLRLEHPLTGEGLRLVAPLPPDMAALVDASLLF